MIDQLSAAKAAFAANECTSTLPQTIDSLRGEAKDLPASVTESVRKSLISGIDHLDALAASDCDIAAPVVTDTETVETFTEETETQETVTEETVTDETNTEETIPGDPATETSEPTTEKPPRGQTKTKPTKPPKGSEGFVGEGGE